VQLGLMGFEGGR